MAKKQAEIFDFDEALSALQGGKSLTGKDGVLTPLIKQLTEAALAVELESHLDEEASPLNRRNGHTSNGSRQGSPGLPGGECPADDML